MSLEISITGVKVKEIVIQEINTNTLKVKGIYFDFDKTEATAIIVFGNKDSENNFIELKTESWNIKGQYYIDTISGTSTGTSIAEVLLNSIVDVVTKIQSDSNLKQQLIDSQELIIS